MREYLESTSARIARVTLGIAVLAVGMVAMAGADAIYVIAGAPPLLIVGGIFTVGLAIAQHRLAALMLSVILPFGAGLYVPLLYAARSFGPAAGLAVGALGVAIMTATMVNPILRAPSRKEAHA